MIKEIYPIPAFADNYIWAIRESGGNSLCVVDPGDAKPVIEYITHHQLQLTDILVTHHHLDHTGGIIALASNYSPHIRGPANDHIGGLTEQLQEGDCFKLFEHEFEVLEVPGHTLDHIAFYNDNSTLDDDPILFCGDTLFAAGCGRLFEGTADQMHQSLAKLKSLPPETQVYCTHEYTLANLKFALTADPTNHYLKTRHEEARLTRQAGKPTLPSNIALELATNPFLRCNQNDVITTVRERTGKFPADQAVDESEVFAELRRWKDQF